jgi:hypothetical protein
VQNVDLAASNSPSRNMTANKSNHWDPQTTRNIQKYMQTCHGNEDYQIGFSWGEKNTIHFIYRETLQGIRASKTGPIRSHSPSPELIGQACWKASPITEPIRVVMVR